jgi:hypothetical protein
MRRESAVGICCATVIIVAARRHHVGVGGDSDADIHALLPVSSGIRGEEGETWLAQFDGSRVKKIMAAVDGDW